MIVSPNILAHLEWLNGKKKKPSSCCTLRTLSSLRKYTCYVNANPFLVSCPSWHKSWPCPVPQQATSLPRKRYAYPWHKNSSRHAQPLVGGPLRNYRVLPLLSWCMDSVRLKRQLTIRQLRSLHASHGVWLHMKY